MARGAPSDMVRIGWELLADVPSGKRVFSWLIGRAAPYSGSIHAEVLELRTGYARVQMRDRRRLRNHLQCLHAIALSNLAEYTGNLALAYTIASDARFIVTRVDMEYLKKARGTIVATCQNFELVVDGNDDTIIEVELRDRASVLVARGVLFSRLGDARSANRGAAASHRDSDVRVAAAGVS